MACYCTNIKYEICREQGFAIHRENNEKWRGWKRRRHKNNEPKGMLRTNIRTLGEPWGPMSSDAIAVDLPHLALKCAQWYLANDWNQLTCWNHMIGIQHCQVMDSSTMGSIWKAMPDLKNGHTAYYYSQLRSCWRSYQILYQISNTLEFVWRWSPHIIWCHISFMLNKYLNTTTAAMYLRDQAAHQ